MRWQVAGPASERRPRTTPQQWQPRWHPPRRRPARRGGRPSRGPRAWPTASTRVGGLRSAPPPNGSPPATGPVRPQRPARRGGPGSRAQGSCPRARRSSPSPTRPWEGSRGQLRAAIEEPEARVAVVSGLPATPPDSRSSGAQLGMDDVVGLDDVVRSAIPSRQVASDGCPSHPASDWT
jgi:hypothetical protein